MQISALLLSAFLALAPVQAGAQFSNPVPVTSQDRWNNVLANAAIGAVVGGMRAAVAGRSIKSGFVRGTIGGSVLSAGKQLASSDFSAAGIIGRSVNAVGIAVIASGTRDTLAVWLPVGPVTLEFVPRATDRFRPRLNLWTTVIATASLLDSRARFDRQASLNAGAFVFEVDEEGMPWGSGEAGFAHPGVIFLNFILADRPQDRAVTIRHEAVHILQWDEYHALVTRPIERALLNRLPGGRRFNRHVELHVLAPLTVWAIASGISDEKRPWEREAYRLTGESPDTAEEK